MRRKARLGSLVLLPLALLLLGAARAGAGPYGDALSKCLVRSTTEADRSELVKWMFAAMSFHPEVRSLVKISASERERLNAGTAELFRELLTERCRSEAREALRYEGESTIQQGFSVLGNVPGRGLMAHPRVNAFTARLGKHLEPESLKRELRASPPASPR